MNRSTADLADPLEIRRLSVTPSRQVNVASRETRTLPLRHGGGNIGILLLHF